MASVVDPYARANFLFSFSKDTSSGNFSSDIEEATLTSLDLPYSLEVTLGKFKPHFTKVNTLHPHAFSFVDFPSMLTRYFTDEGLFMEGVSASWLVPNPSDFYQELDVEIGRSESNNTLDQGNANKMTYVGHLKNFFELTDNATLEFGLSGLSGVNAQQFTTNMGGVDITYKWKPVQFNTFQSFTWQTEAIVCRTSTLAAANVQTYGAYSFVEYQIEKRTFLGAQYDYSALPGNKSNEDRVSSLLIRFQPTEFQILALGISARQPQLRRRRKSGHPAGNFRHRKPWGARILIFKTSLIFWRASHNEKFKINNCSFHPVEYVAVFNRNEPDKGCYDAHRPEKHHGIYRRRPR